MSEKPQVKLAIVIPAYNEATSIGKVLTDLQGLKLSSIEKEVLVVDDGSTDPTSEIAKKFGAIPIRHLINRGLGAALGTGICAAVQLEADIILTFDADGQHAVEDIPRVIAPLQKQETDVVIGTRMRSKGNMPSFRKMANHVANCVTLLLFGVRSSDSQSGLRAFSQAAAKKMKISANHYEVSSEIFREIRRHSLKVVEIPIRTFYSPYSLAKGQGFWTGWKTLLRLILYKNMG